MHGGGSLPHAQTKSPNELYALGSVLRDGPGLFDPSF